MISVTFQRRFVLNTLDLWSHCYQLWHHVENDCNPVYRLLKSQTKAACQLTVQSIAFIVTSSRCKFCRSEIRCIWDVCGLGRITEDSRALIECLQQATQWGCQWLLPVCTQKMPSITSLHRLLKKIMCMERQEGNGHPRSGWRWQILCVLD